MISKKPIEINLPLEELGVTDEMFAHKSVLHGAGHVNRVIFNAMTLCRSMGYGDIMPECWAAAYLHDLARRHGGTCYNHGKWAVEEQWVKYEPMFKAAGVRDYWAVKDAVMRHSVPASAGGENPSNRVCQVLKDADALDRCRLGDLDPRFLRLERSQMLIRYAERLFNTTHEYPEWDHVWGRGVTIYNPHVGIADETPMPWDPSEGGRARMLRRLAAGATPKEVILASKHPLHADGELVTYVSPETLEAIKKEGRFLSFWELDERGIPSWHHRFTDNPQDARAYNERRLFGERCREMVYGVFDTAGTSDDADERMRHNYGKLRVHLSPILLPSCSFTVEDSQLAPYTVPLDDFWIRCAWDSQRFHPWRYLEAQIHEPVTVNHITKIE